MQVTHLKPEPAEAFPAMLMLLVPAMVYWFKAAWRQFDHGDDRRALPLALV